MKQIVRSFIIGFTVGGLSIAAWSATAAQATAPAPFAFVTR